VQGYALRSQSTCAHQLSSRPGRQHPEPAPYGVVKAVGLASIYHLKTNATNETSGAQTVRLNNRQETGSTDMAWMAPWFSV
jgi:hypothetical protein